MPSPVDLEVDDVVKADHLGVVMYGTVKWLGDFPEGAEMAGIEMVSTKHVIVARGITLSGVHAHGCLLTSSLDADISLALPDYFPRDSSLAMRSSPGGTNDSVMDFRDTFEFVPSAAQGLYSKSTL